MTTSKKILLVSAFAALALAGCGGGGGKAMAPQPPPAAVRIEDQFGAGFGTAFRQDRNVESTEPAAGDLEPLSLTTEPREIS